MASIKTFTCDTPSVTINGYMWGRSAVATATRWHRLFSPSHLLAPWFRVRVSLPALLRHPAYLLRQIFWYTSRAHCRGQRSPLSNQLWQRNTGDRQTAAVT